MQQGIIGFDKHNHQQCVIAALEQADAYCVEHKLRFTKVRRRALGILLESHSALSAYDLLDRLREEGLGSEPPVAYRALNFLLEHGFVHRVEKLNAFIACAHPGARHQPAFLICSTCGTVAETAVTSPDVELSEAARQSGFRISKAIMEAEGRCPACQ